MIFHEHHQTQPWSECNGSGESLSYSAFSGPSQSSSSLDSTGILKPSIESPITPPPRAYIQHYQPQQNCSDNAAFFSSQEALLGRLEGPSRESVVSPQTQGRQDGGGIRTPPISYCANKTACFPDIERNQYCTADMEYRNPRRKTKILWSSRMDLKVYVTPLSCLPPPAPPIKRRNNNYFRDGEII